METLVIVCVVTGTFECFSELMCILNHRILIRAGDPYLVPIRSHGQ